jgi:predicted alpha/beta-hydrolase family hydrolase
VSGSELVVDLETGARTTALVYPAHRASRSALILAHGAGAGQRSRFIVAFATALSGLDLETVTFNFLYTERRRRIPDPLPTLTMCFRAVMAAARQELASARRSLFIGGKSLGGRVATHVAAEASDIPISGIVLLGYPFHPPGRPNATRDAQLPSVGRPMLFVQGTRDPFGTPSELKPVLDGLRPRPALYAVEGGDHSFTVSRRDQARQASTDADIQRRIAEWCDHIARVSGAAVQQ